MNIKELSDSMPIPTDIPRGDMPGDKVNIAEGQIRNARGLFPHLYDMIVNAAQSNPYGRVVVSVYGGSGSGKSGMASILTYMLTQAGIPGRMISGDNYPNRIPADNDNERLHIYRIGGIKALRDTGSLSGKISDELSSLMKGNGDADEANLGEYDWLAAYIAGGSKALGSYLGSPAEIDYDDINNILAAFKDGVDTLWLKRMGRDEAAIRYEETDVSDVKVLILEWTHGNNSYLKNVDIPILLNSTPEETLEYRLSRGRDGQVDSPFTMLTLKLEQELLDSQTDRAAIIMSKSGKLLSLEEALKDHTHKAS